MTLNAQRIKAIWGSMPVYMDSSYRHTTLKARIGLVVYWPKISFTNSSFRSEVVLVGWAFLCLET